MAGGKKSSPRSDPNLNLFGQTFACPCGKTHVIEPRETYYGDDAVAQLVAICDRASQRRCATVLMDVRTRQAAGAEIVQALEEQSWRVVTLIVPDPAAGQSPVCDDLTKHALALELGEPDLVLTVGSGVITDLGKWLAFERSKPFVSFATAASMNGYASANVAPTIAGVKTLVRARPAVAVVSSPAVLRDAPYEMTAAGFGDALAKSVSSADWHMNHRLFGDYYCERAVGLCAELEPRYLGHPAAIRQRQPGAMAALYEALLLTGVAMTMAETSAPASGGEHMISHSLDMMSSLDGREHDLHGRQVGVGTVLMSELYRRVLAVESPRFVAPPSTIDAKFWGRLADEVSGHYSQKKDRLRAAAEKLSRRQAWDDLRQALQPMLHPPEMLHKALHQAGAATTAADIKCDQTRLLAAFTHAHEIRSRVTVLDLGYLLGILPGAIPEMTEMWAKA